MRNYVYVSLDHALTPILTSVLQRHLGSESLVREGLATSVAPGDVAIVSERACPPSRVAQLCTLGMRPIVLAALPSGTREKAYMEAGAKYYLPLDPQVATLVDALRVLLWPGRAVFASP